MIQVPELRRVNSQQRVSETDLPGVKTPVNQPIEAFGGGQEELTRASQQLSGVVGKVAEQEMNRADEIVLTDAKVKSSEGLNDIFYNTKTGIFATMQGKNALGSSEEFKNRYGKLTEEIEKGLNNRQKLAFGKIKDQDYMSGNSWAEKHTLGEIDKYENETLLAGKISAKNNAILKVPAGEDAMQDFLDIGKNIEKLGAKQGWDRDKINLEIGKEQSDTNLSIIENLVSQNRVSDAKEYMSNIGTDGLVGDDITKANKLIKAGSIEQEAKNKADELAIKYPGDLPAQRNELEKDVKEVELFDATLQRLTRNDDYRNRFEREENEKNFKDASLIALRDGVMPPTPLMLKLTINQNEEIMRLLNMKAKGESPTTDWGLYQELKDMASIGQNKVDFANLNLFNYQSKLGSKEFNELLNIQEAVRKNDTENILSLTSGWSENYQIINKNLNAFGIDIQSQPGDDDYMSVVGYRRAVDQQVEYEKKRLGKQFLSNEEIQKIADKVLTEPGRIISEPTIFGGKRWYLDFSDRVKTPVFSEEQNVGTTFRIEDVPEEEIGKIRAAYLRQGKKATEKDIVDLYNRKMNKATK